MESSVNGSIELLYAESSINSLVKALPLAEKIVFFNRVVLGSRKRLVADPRTYGEANTIFVFLSNLAGEVEYELFDETGVSLYDTLPEVEGLDAAYEAALGEGLEYFNRDRS